MNINLTKKTFILSISLFFLPSVASGFSSNTWKHMKSEHFTLSYNEKTEDRVAVTLDMAEEIAATLREYFGSDITKTPVAIVLNDHHDYSQGSAYRYLDLVTIDARKTEPFLRGETRWLKNVLAHELSHIYTLRIMQRPILLSVGILSDSKNEEGHMAVNYQHNRLPLWFVEGIAQWGSNKCDVDSIDPFREMLLRDAFFHDSLLSLEEMSRFEGTTREYELAYNQGFNLILYLADTYPDKQMKSLCSLVRKKGFRSAIFRFYGKHVEDLYEEWRSSLAKRYSGDWKQIEGKVLFQGKRRPMNLEIMSADKGRYVISNWRHDYNRLDLMIMSEDRQRVERVITEVGNMLKMDKDSKTVWFNRKVYNYQTGVLGYDIFQIDSLGRVKRMTRGERCMAFDYRDGHLMFTSYHNGITFLKLKAPDGSISTLYTFPYDTAIYSLSMISGDSAVISIGKGTKIKAGIIRKDSLKILWEGLEGDTLDCVYAGSDRLLLVSTIDGTPQIYWCDLKKRDLWYKVTAVSGGVRYPSLDWNQDQPDQPGVSCSVFERGHFTIHTLSNPFSQEHPVDLSLFLKAESENSERSALRTPITMTEKTSKNFIFHTPAFYFLYNHSDLGYLTKQSELSIGSIFSLQNAPGNFEIDLQCGLSYPVGYQTTSSFEPDLGISFKIDLWQIRMSQEFSQSTYSSEQEREEEFICEKLQVINAKTKAMYQLFKDDFLTLAYEYTGIRRKLLFHMKDSNLPPYMRDGDEGYDTVHVRDTYILDWEHTTCRDKFDPGHLGEPQVKIKAGVDYFSNSYPDYESDETGQFSSEESNASRMRFEFGKRSLFSESKLSLAFGVSGFYYEGGIQDGKISPYMYEYIGQENFFSGYQPALRARRAIRICGEMRFNPLISIFDGITWYERMHLGLKLEMGAVDYFDYGLISTNLASLEGAFRYYFYVWPDSLSSFYFKVATPVKEIHGLDNAPRCYFGLTIN